MKISKISADEIDQLLPDLVETLKRTVEADGAVGFVAPLADDAAAAFWQQNIKQAIVSGDRIMIVAVEEGKLAGTGQLIVGMPNNQPHRAEISKLMVHPDFRRRGVARQIMAELEGEATQLGRTLITLDTRTGDSAEPLYLSLGYKTAGTIPNYAKNAIGDDFHATTYMYKQI
ncbi:GNAT family N-acetyltransferase [Maritalea sp.]|jgi:ribosomal protein S18 acetylase RimI-like enzyme|uniref:GNAT family N-acetyltransferase n=1 Tax=Maritalea sp. TaxID=2003361 RepID=UPI0039E5F3FE